jgi:hypothetical protein
MWCLPTEKVVRYKTSLICCRSTNEIFSEPLQRKTKMEKENSCSQPSSSGIIVLCDYLAIYNQRRQKLSKRKKRDQFCPTFMPGKYSQTSTVAPSIRWRVEYTRRDRVKGVLVNTPTFTWAYTRAFKERGKGEIRNSMDTGSFTNGMLFIWKNRKWVMKKNWLKQQVRESWKRDTG